MTPLPAAGPDQAPAAGVKYGPVCRQQESALLAVVAGDQPELQVGRRLGRGPTGPGPASCGSCTRRQLPSGIAAGCLLQAAGGMSAPSSQRGCLWPARGNARASPQAAASARPWPAPGRRSSRLTASGRVCGCGSTRCWWWLATRWSTRLARSSPWAPTWRWAAAGAAGAGLAAGAGAEAAGAGAEAGLAAGAGSWGGAGLAAGAGCWGWTGCWGWLLGQAAGLSAAGLGAALQALGSGRRAPPAAAGDSAQPHIHPSTHPPAAAAAAATHPRAATTAAAAAAAAAAADPAEPRPPPPPQGWGSELWPCALPPPGLLSYRMAARPDALLDPAAQFKVPTHKLVARWAAGAAQSPCPCWRPCGCALGGLNPASPAWSCLRPSQRPAPMPASPGCASPRRCARRCRSGRPRAPRASTATCSRSASSSTAPARRAGAGSSAWARPRSRCRRTRGRARRAARAAATPSPRARAQQPQQLQQPQQPQQPQQLQQLPPGSGGRLQTRRLQRLGGRCCSRGSRRRAASAAGCRTAAAGRRAAGARGGAAPAAMRTTVGVAGWWWCCGSCVAGGAACAAIPGQALACRAWLSVWCSCRCCC
jgi:hypothetical protein